MFTQADALEKRISSIFRRTVLLQFHVKVIRIVKFVSDFGRFKEFGLSRVWKTRKWGEFVWS